MSEHDLQAEAEAFDTRIKERLTAGYIPDLRNLKSCHYFYKSFWREPLYAQLFLGESVSRIESLLLKHAGPARRVLDLGCGPGYVALELARAGHHVTGVDISSAAIAAAKEAAKTPEHRENFGSLEYHVSPVSDVSGEYDVVLFSGILHHLSSPLEAVQKSRDLLRSKGLLIVSEPCHDRFTPADAAQVALIRQLLALSGLWYEEPCPSGGFAKYAADVHEEYVEERDLSEKDGQSPNDLSANGAQILSALRTEFDEVVHEPGFSFIYRLLGGLRGPTQKTEAIARFLAEYDRTGVAQGWLNPNGFFWLGTPKAS